MRSTTSAVSFRQNDIIGQIIDNIQTTAQSVVSQIEAAVNQGQQLGAHIVSQFQTTVSQLQLLGSDIHSSASAILQTFLQGVGGIFGGQSRGVTNEVVGSAVYHLMNQWNLDHHVTGALNNNIVQWIAALIARLGVSSLVQNAVSAVIGSQMTTFIFDHFDDDSRSFLSSLQGVFGQVSSASQQLLATIGQSIQQLTNVAQENFQQLQILATDFASGSIVQVQTTVNDAASEFLTFLTSYQQGLGNIYGEVVAQVGVLVGSFN